MIRRTKGNFCCLLNHGCRVPSGVKQMCIFFAGHGLASEDGKKIFLPYDGAPELLIKALLRKELFDDIAGTGPRQ